jgi:signal transduction histidine kinase
VEFHGGTIGLVPSPLGGTCLSFSLPLEEPQTDA